MENIILMCAAGAAIVICLTATFLAARRIVNNNQPIKPIYKQSMPDVQEGEVPIDNTIKHLKLVNLD